MSRKIVKHTATFIAIDDTGKEYTIHEFTEFIEGQSNSGPYRVKGFKTLRTDDGCPVNRKSKGEYSLVDINEIMLTSNDLNAP